MPRVSVVIPCFNSAADLEACLAHLARSSFQDFECIVSDDGSSDATAEIARRAPLAVKLVRQGARRGPAAARNSGARAATGDLLAFFDADVCVHNDTLERMARAFDGEPDLGALIGSYDDTPTHRGFYSRFRNLLHCFVHRTGNREASTFWAGCGSIRRALFLEHGGFDESYRRPSIEDIELGYRLRQAGVRIELDPRIQVKHRKRWTLLSGLKSDFFDRGLPWTRLILRDRHLPADLNLKYHQRVSVMLLWLAPPAAVVNPLAGLACLLGAAALQWRFYRFLAQAGGTAFAIAAVPFHLLHLFVAGASFLAGVLTPSRPAPPVPLGATHSHKPLPRRP